MADVTMSLSELDELRSKIAELESKNTDLIEKQKLVLVQHKFFNGKISSGKQNGKVQITSLEYVSPEFRGYGNPMGSYRNSIIDYDLSEAISKGIVVLDLQEDPSRQSTDYINMSEATELIRQEEKLKVKSLLDELSERSALAEHQLANSKIDSKKEIERVKNDYTERIQNLNDLSKKDKENFEKKLAEIVERLNKRYDKLNQEYEDFKADKKRVTLEQQIVELNHQIEELTAKKRRSFFSTWF